MIHPTANIYGELGDIGEGTKIGAFCDIGSPNIGKNCKIQCHVSIPSGIIIEDDVFVGPGARFANDRNPQADEDWDARKMQTTVRKRASIGMGALIGAGLEIGENAIIGMGAVVTKNVPAGEVWVGNPAKPLITDIRD